MYLRASLSQFTAQSTIISQIRRISNMYFWKGTKENCYNVNLVKFYDTLMIINHAN